MKEKIENSNNNMFDVMKELLISEKEFTGTNYKKITKRFGLHRKQFNRFWWWYVFNSWLFDRNK